MLKKIIFHMAQMMTNRKHNAQTLDRHDKKTISLMSSSKIDFYIQNLIQSQSTNFWYENQI